MWISDDNNYWYLNMCLFADVEPAMLNCLVIAWLFFFIPRSRRTALMAIAKSVLLTTPSYQNIPEFDFRGQKILKKSATQLLQTAKHMIALACWSWVWWEKKCRSKQVTVKASHKTFCSKDYILLRTGVEQKRKKSRRIFLALPSMVQCVLKTGKLITARKHSTIWRYYVIKIWCFFVPLKGGVRHT